MKNERRCEQKQEEQKYKAHNQQYKILSLHFIVYQLFQLPF